LNVTRRRLVQWFPAVVAVRSVWWEVAVTSSSMDTTVTADRAEGPGIPGSHYTVDYVMQMTKVIRPHVLQFYEHIFYVLLPILEKNFLGLYTHLQMHYA
jgi:hypothetical protein